VEGRKGSEEVSDSVQKRHTDTHRDTETYMHMCRVFTDLHVQGMN
jgi:hypothetical protein